MSRIILLSVDYREGLLLLWVQILSFFWKSVSWETICGDPVLSGGWESEFVRCNNNSRSKSNIVLNSEVAVLDLSFVSFSSQLPAELRALRQTSRSKRMPLGDQTTGRIDDNSTAVGVVTGVNELASFAFFAELESFVSDQLVRREAIVE